MPLQRQLLPIQIGGGIDTKTDDKKVVASKLITLENGVFTKPGQISKRNGYEGLPLTISGGGTITNPKAAKAYNDELVCAAESSLNPGDGRLFSFSEALQTWIDKGKYIPTKVTQTNISSDIPELTADGSSNGTYFVSSWISISVTDSTKVDVYYTVRDISTGEFLVPETIIATYLSLGSTNIQFAPAVVVVGTNKFGIFYLERSAPNNKISCRIVTISGGAVSVAAAVTIFNGLKPTASRNLFSAVAVSTGAAVMVHALSGSDVRVLLVDSAGTVTATATVASAIVLTPTQIYVQFNSFNNSIWTYFATGGILHYAVYSSTLTPILANTDTLLSARRPVASSQSSTVQVCYYYDDQTGDIPQVYRVSLTSAGVVGSPVQIAAEGVIFADPIERNSRVYLPLFYQRTAQSLYAFIDVQDGQVVATALSGSAMIIMPFAFGPVTRPFYLGANQFGFNFTYQYAPTFPTGGALAPLATTMTELDFAHPDAYQALPLTNSLIWNGGVITDYDGQYATELGFFLFPEIITATQGAAGNMADGQYQYEVVYEWYDNVGRFHQSAPSLPATVVITGGGGTASVDLVIQPLTMTAKQSPYRFPVQVTIYRTQANGTIFHSINDPSNVIFNTPFAQIAFTDGGPDSAIASTPEIYTTGGVVDNIIPPSALQMTIYNNRLWLVDSQATTTVWYSKTVTPGIGLAFSDLLTANIDQRQGEITALGAFDDKIVFFKKTVPFFSVGDGANDLGLSSSLSLPQIVASDVGCKASKSVLLNMPQGIMFQSDKGIYVIDRALQAQYIGKDVEAYNSQTIVSANLIDAKSQIRFLCSDGVELVYDYIYDQWSTFTNHLGYGADIWQGNYTYCRVDGDIYTETPGVFIDKATAISLKIGTAWIKLTEVQNFERLRRLFVIGDYKSPHLLNGQVFFDYEATETTAAAFQFDPQTVLGLHGDDSVYQFRYHLERQKCESARFVISDDFTGLTPGEGYSLSQLSIEAGLKQGGNKLSPYKSVG